MKGYDTSNGYMGYVEGKYILFASEQEYFEFMHYRGYIYVILENENPIRKRTRQ